jgi:2-oxoisovalerate dehydrogenase E1 component
MPHAAAPKKVRSRKDAVDDSRLDWRRVAYHVLVSRALDDLEEATNRNRGNVPREHQVLYQFSARGHDVGQIILGSLLDHAHDGIGAYYRSRPMLLALGLPIVDALGSPLGRSGGFSDGRDIGVVCNLPRKDGPIVIPMSGDVGSQYTPTAGWAQAITYRRDTLGDRSWDRAIAVVLGGEASAATNGFWSALTIATTLKLPMLFYIDDNGLGISVKSDLQTPGANIARNLESFTNLFVRDGDGCDPADAARLLAECVAHVRGGEGPALVRLTVPRLSRHSGPDNQKGYRTEEEIAADLARDPLPNLRKFLVPALFSEADWSELEETVARDVAAAADRARARPAPEPTDVRRFVYAEERRPSDVVAFGGLSEEERRALGGSESPSTEGEFVRLQEAVRRTLARELEVNP